MCDLMLEVLNRGWFLFFQEQRPKLSHAELQALVDDILSDMHPREHVDQFIEFVTVHGHDVLPAALTAA